MRPNLAVAAALVGVAILLAFFYQSAVFDSRAGEDTPLYSVRRHDPYGTAAMHDLLVERGNPVRTLQRPELDPSDHGVLIQVFTGHEALAKMMDRSPDSLLSWISQGNTVLQFSQTSTVLMTHESASHLSPQSNNNSPLEQFEISGGAPDKTPAAVVMADTESPTPQRLLLWSPMTFDDSIQSGWKPLARLDNHEHQIVAAEKRIGRGKLIVVGSPTPVLNATIDQDDNLDFLLGIVGKQPVILDEWSHGIGQERTVVNFLTDVGLLPMLFQIVFVVALYVWSTSGFVPPVEEKVARQRSSAEQIETLGYLYGRSLNRAITFDRIEKEVQRRLSEALRCQPRELPSRLAKVTPALRERIGQLFARLGSLRAGQGVKCQSCGYDLSFNQSGNCPECGAAISPNAQANILETQPQSEVRSAASSQAPSPKRRRSKSMNAALAEILTTSHQLTLEVNRDRRGPR